jgi:putative ABC transport system permease protein
MWILALAARNLRRNLRRTAITGVAVVAGVTLLIMGRALVDGLDENVIRAQIDTVGGHFTLTPPGYDVDDLAAPVDELQPVPDTLLAKLGDQVWTPRLRFDARLIYRADALPVRGIGFVPETDVAVFPRDGFGLSGRFPGPGHSGVVLGHGLAAVIEVGLGDRVTLQTRTAKGAQNAMDYPVLGIVRAGNPVVDNFTVFLTFDAAQALVQAPGPSHLSVRLPRRSETSAVAASLAGQWPATTYLEEAEDILAINRIRRNALSMLVLAVLGIAAIGIANTIIMSVYERVREIGTLAAMGMAPRAIGTLFLFEGALLGGGAAMVGAVVGAGISWRLSTVGLDLGALPEAGSRIAMSTVLYTSFDLATVLGAGAFGVVVTVLASVFPAAHAVRINPADAVRAD